MEDYVPTQEERARLVDGFRRMDEARAYWEEHEDEFYPRYEGQWVAMDGPRIVAHSADSDALATELDSLGVDRARLWIRWIPPTDTVFAYSVMGRSRGGPGSQPAQKAHRGAPHRRTGLGVVRR